MFKVALVLVMVKSLGVSFLFAESFLVSSRVFHGEEAWIGGRWKGRERREYDWIGDKNSALSNHEIEPFGGIQEDPHPSSGVSAGKDAGDLLQVGREYFPEAFDLA